MLEEAIKELTKLLIKQDFAEKEVGKSEYITIKKNDLIKLCIDLLKLIERSG